jgi:hypothetical protein
MTSLFGAFFAGGASGVKDMKVFHWAATVVLSAVVASTALAQNTIDYRYVQLPNSRHYLTFGDAVSINNRGDILLVAADSQLKATGYGILRNNGFIFTQLERNGTPRALNTQGTVVGQDSLGPFFVENDWPQRHFRIQGEPTQVYGINFRNELCGSFGDPGEEHGFYGRLFNFKFFDVPNAQSTVITGISGIGGICGTFVDQQGASHGFYMLKRFETVDYPGATDTHMVGVNNLGSVLGWYSMNTGPSQLRRSAFIYAGGTYFQLNFPAPASTRNVTINGQATTLHLMSYETVPTAINDYGMIVGSVKSLYANGDNSNTIGFSDNFVGIPVPKHNP